MSRKDSEAEHGHFGRLDGYEGALGGLNRRDFLKFCTGVAATLGLSPYLGVRIAEAATAPTRPPVFWLSGQACTGCTETLLRASHPKSGGWALAKLGYLVDSVRNVETCRISPGSPCG